MQTINRLVFLVLICLLMPFVAQSQLSSLRGTVYSSESVEIPFATVAVLSPVDSSLVKAGTSNQGGIFLLRGIEPGGYQLRVSYIGFASYETVINLEPGENLLEGIILEPMSTELDGLVITEERPLIEVMADKTVFNVANEGTSAGLSGFELMRKAPGVIIDNNDNLVLEGKSGVQIWIDGRPSILSGDALTQYLRSIQASDIEAIEIITQPSSKYDAEGTAGIINIKLKRDKRYGVNGTVSSGVAYGRYWKHNHSFSLNQRSKQLNIFGSYSNRFTKTFHDMDFRQQIQDQVYDESSEAVRDDIDHNLKAGLDFYASDKSTLGFTVSGNLTDGKEIINSTTDIQPATPGASTAVLQALSESDYQRQNVFVNTNYRFEDTLGHSLSFDLDYGQFSSDRANLQPNRYFDAAGNQYEYSNYRLQTPVDVELKAAKVDYSQNALAGTLGFGLKYSQVQTDNVFDFSREEAGVLVYRPEDSNEFEFTEEVAAAYFNYSFSKNKWTFQTGLRLENTHSLGELSSTQQIDDDRVERDYLDYFPSAGLTYQYNQSDSWALNYSRRINRPDYESLNPFEQRLNELGFRKGNPFLRPNYANYGKLSHTYKYRYTTSVSYSYVADYYAQITDTLEAVTTGGDFNPSFIQARNVADEQVIAVTLSAPIDLSEYWSLYLNLSGSRSIYKSNEPKFNPIEQSTFSFYAQNTFQLPKDWTLQVSGWYSTASVWGGTFVTDPLGALDLSVQRKFFKKKLSANLSMTDILYSSPWTATGEFNNLSIDGKGAYESRQVRLNLSYNFGNPELKTRKERKAAAEQELERIK